MKPAFVFLALGLFLAGCPTPPTPLDKASETAREANMAARWGMMNVALQKTAPELQADYLERHSKWHAETRIVDTELAAIALVDGTHANVQVDISWTLEGTTTLRVTRVEQVWENGKGGWKMTSEKRIGGAIGLFGEEVKSAEPQRDRHFPTKVISGE